MCVIIHVIFLALDKTIRLFRIHAGTCAMRLAKTVKRMSMYNYGIGGNEVKLDASEAIADIPSNRTLLVQKLTEDDPANPELVYGLKTIDEVFQKFQPKVNVEMETANGETKPETLAFGKLSDFNADQVIRQSPFLNGLEMRQELYTKMARQLSSNKVLQKALGDEATRAAIIQAIDQAMAELADSNK